MKIFITTGSTELVNIDKLVAAVKPFGVVKVQSPIRLRDISISYVSFVDNIREEYEKADLVICNAGAGTVFQILEMNKSMIIVPDLDRLDDHQSDLAQFIERNDYACVCWDYEELPLAISQIRTVPRNKYLPDLFNGGRWLSSYIKEHVNAF